MVEVDVNDKLSSLRSLWSSVVNDVHGTGSDRPDGASASSVCLRTERIHDGVLEVGVYECLAENEGMGEQRPFIVLAGARWWGMKSEKWFSDNDAVRVQPFRVQIESRRWVVGKFDDCFALGPLWLRLRLKELG